MPSRYPILVERLSAKQALRILCERCGAEDDITADEMCNDGWYACPKDCGGIAEFKYMEADHKCPNCGKLGYFPDSCKPCCSRVCKLQADWAQTLYDRELSNALGQ